MVRAGMVQVSVTLSPLRAARKLTGGRGNSSEGGSGGPIDAHPVKQTNAASASHCPRRSFMRKQQTTSVARLALADLLRQTVVLLQHFPQSIMGQRHHRTPLYSSHRLCS